MNRSGRLVSTAAAAGVVLVVAGCGGTSSGRILASGQSPLSSAPPAHPTVVGVTCEANGTMTTTGTAVVGRDGLHLTVTDRSGRKDTYLNYGSGRVGGPGGGDAVLARTTERVLMVPPGDVYLGCSYDLGAKTTVPVRVRATDPNGYYRLVSLDALGCRPGAFLDWARGPTRGRTAEAALGALVAARPSGRA